jgi:HSP20 family molecular chaperone IbpA
MRVTTLPETQPHEHNGHRHIPPVLRARHPAVDVYETDDDVIIEVDAPGFRRHEITVEVGERCVWIAGARSEEPGERDYLRRERVGACFERELELPDGIDVSRLTGAFDCGLLQLKAPRVLPLPRRRVPIVATHTPDWARIHADATPV